MLNKFPDYTQQLYFTSNLHNHDRQCNAAPAIINKRYIFILNPEDLYDIFNFCCFGGYHFSMRN